ncbi:FG-GAP repeat protein [Vibrio owensii]|uniref:FG-GAP repeat protein n=1 Tax=Vibrio owensii TaxID=696485 RepID=UPI001FD27294|nr:FG-GAP repeat protein [Vibrio owensii]
MKALLLLVTCSTLFLTACNDTETGTELVTPPQQQEVELPKTPDVEPTPDPIQPPESEKPPLPPVDTPPVLPPKAKPKPDPVPEKQPDQNQNKQPDENRKQQPDRNQNRHTDENKRQQPDQDQNKQPDENRKQQPDQNRNKQADEDTKQQPDHNQDKQPDEDTKPQPDQSQDKQADENTKQQPDQNQNKQTDENAKQQPDQNQNKQPDEDTKQQPNQNQNKQPDEDTKQQPDQNQDKQPDENTTQQPEPPVIAPDPTPVPMPPSAFTLSAPTSVSGKTFLFQWQTSQNADEYTLCRKNTTSADNCDVLSSGLTQTNKQVELNSLLSTNETYFVVASNKDGSQKSNEVSIEPSALLNSIGLLKASNTDSNDNYGNAVAVSNDGSTIAVSAFKESGIVNDPTVNSAALSGAVYVYRKTNGIWNEVAYLKAPNADDKDEFGYAIALSGDGNTLAVSTINEASSATGIDGNQLDNLAPASGAVYLYVNSGSSWQSQAYIKSSNSNLVDSFGFSVSLDSDGTTLLVGAPGESSSAQSINGDETDNTGSLSGAAYVFELQNNQWTQTAYLKSTNSDKLDSFGYDVALSEDGLTVVVGSPGEDSNATSVNGDEMDNSSDNSGSAYVFVHNGTTWAQDSYLKASNSDSEDQFGHSVDVNSDGTVIAIGAFNEASDSEINGNESDNSASGAGAAYLFYKSQAGWQQEDYMKAVNSDGSDHFGSDVQLSSNGKALVVGSPNESSSSQGLDGDVQLNDASAAGAVYLFTDVEGTWQQTEYIKSRNTDAGDGFGSAIAISGDGNTLIVGAKDEASDGSDFNDNSSSGSGAAYIY